MNGTFPFQPRFISVRIFLFAFFLVSLLNIPPSFADPSTGSKFESKGDVVVDRQTGLVWQKADSYHEFKKGINWYEAQEYIDGKNAQKFGGYGDWRLPTKDELISIWDASRPVKSKDGEKIGLPGEFKEGGSYYLWTAEERGLDNAWYFGLGHKEDYFNLKELGDLDQGVKMVRSSKGSEG